MIFTLLKAKDNGKNLNSLCISQNNILITADYIQQQQPGHVDNRRIHSRGRTGHRQHIFYRFLGCG